MPHWGSINLRPLDSAAVSHDRRGIARVRRRRGTWVRRRAPRAAPRLRGLRAKGTSTVATASAFGCDGSRARPGPGGQQEGNSPSRTPTIPNELAPRQPALQSAPTHSNRFLATSRNPKVAGSSPAPAMNGKAIGALMIPIVKRAPGSLGPRGTAAGQDAGGSRGPVTWPSSSPR